MQALQAGRQARGEMISVHSRHRGDLQVPFQLTGPCCQFGYASPISVSLISARPGAAGRFGPGHFRLERLDEAAGVCGRRGAYGH